MKPFRLRPSVDACAMLQVRRERWLRIGEWIFDPQRNELVRGMERVPLDPKLSVILLHLAGNAGHVVARDELQIELSSMAALGNSAITQAVTKLRRLLGDSARRPAYIETVVKRGYRLIAPVSWVSSDPHVRLPDKPGLFRRLGELFARLRQCLAEYVLFALTFVAVALLLLTASSSAWRSHDDVAALVREAASVRALDTLPVLVIRAFATQEATAEERQLARGLRTQLIADLGRVQSIRIVSADQTRPIASSGRGRNAPVLVMEGGLRQNGDRIAVHVRLTAADTGRALLSEKHERRSADLLEMQSGIVSSLKRALASALDVSLPRSASTLTRSPGAYMHFVQAEALLRDEHAFEGARERYWRAVQLDPLFARAYAGLALTYAGETRHGYGGDKELERALEFAQTAATIDATIPEAYWVVGWVHGQRRNHLEAIKNLRKALALNPSFVDGYGLLGNILIEMGRADQALEVLKTALQLEPNEFLHSLLLGRAYYAIGAHSEAVMHLRVAIERNPRYLESHVYLAAALAQAGQPEAAGWAVEEMRTVSPDFALEPWLNTRAVIESDQLEKLGSALRGLGL